MQTPQDHDDTLLARGGAPAAVIRSKEHVLGLFRDRVRERVVAARKESSPIIINTLPAFITRLALALSPDSDIGFASEYSNIGLAHGNERAKLTGYSLAELVREYQVLREILMDELPRAHPLTEREWRVVHRSIDEVTAEAASAFMQVHQRFRELFTAALTHDFRGPLANAVNYIDLVRRNAEPGQHAYFAARALFNLKRVDNMIGELLDATRAHAGAQISLRIAPFDAGSLAREVVGDLTLRAGDRFVLDIKKDVQGYWDGDRIKQALQNLLENALKYGKEDAPITCHVGTFKGRLFISVHNQGEPIPVEEIPLMFQPFRRSLAAEKSGKAGWGLGLMLVQAIAEAHGGSVGVESSTSEGTIFTLDVLCDARLKQAVPEPEPD